MAIYPWRISPDTFRRFQTLTLQLIELQEHTEPYQAALEEIRRLPGFPAHWDEHNDEIQIEPIPPKQMVLLRPYPTQVH